MFSLFLSFLVSFLRRHLAFIPEEPSSPNRLSLVQQKKRSIKTWSETIEFWAEQGDLKNEFSFILIKQKKKEFCTKTRNETQQNHPRNPPEQVKTVRKWMEELVFLGCFASPFVCLRSQDCCVWWLEEKVLHRCTIGWFLTYVCVGGPNYLRRWMSTDLFLLPRLLFDWEELEEFFFGDRGPIMSQDILNMKLVIYSVARSEFFHLRLLRTIEGFLFLKRVFCFSTALNKMYNYSEKGSKSEGISLASLHEYYFFYENQFAYCIKSRNIFFVGRDQTKDWEIFIKILLNGQMCLDMIMFAEGWLRNWWN